MHIPLADDPINVLGLMTGTSGDGLDGALVRFDGRGGFQFLWHEAFPFPAAVRARLQALMTRAQAREVRRAAAYVAHLYAEGVAAFRARHSEPIHLLAAHGQTLDHDPDGDLWDGIPVRGSLQVLDAALLAERTGLPVTYDFRSRDLAVGGQGAPLVPFGDLRFFGARCRRGLAVLNIGGIANLTVIRPRPIVEPSRRGQLQSGSPEEERTAERLAPTVVAAFDTGPGNMLMDALAARLSGGTRSYDEGGEMARAGRPLPRLLASLLRDPYLVRKPPKSTGRDLFGRPRESRIWRAWGRRASGADLMATFLEFTVETIVGALERFVLPEGPLDEVIVAGGGALNPLLVARLSDRLRDVCPLRRSDVCGVPVMAREAMAFAALGDAFVRGWPGNVPAATGARQPAVLGAFVPGVAYSPISRSSTFQDIP